MLQSNILLAYMEKNCHFSHILYLRVLEKGGGGGTERVIKGLRVSFILESVIFYRAFIEKEGFFLPLWLGGSFMKG